jgi:hypothetical protein
MKTLMLLLFVVVASVPTSAARLECVRWSWTGDVYNRKVVCLEWRNKDTPPVEKKK